MVKHATYIIVDSKEQDDTCSSLDFKNPNWFEQAAARQFSTL